MTTTIPGLDEAEARRRVAERAGTAPDGRVERLRTPGEVGYQGPQVGDWQQDRMALLQRLKYATARAMDDAQVGAPIRTEFYAAVDAVLEAAPAPAHEHPHPVVR